MWDYEHAYPGAPMVAVRGFPRPLYPPDATAQGKKPSIDGPDVEAYKRTVSRAGRWRWQAFDQAFSNGFSHGTSGNVIDTGIAGMQRQQNLDDTGWVGERTFNTLRSIVIPAELPHAGEMAMDARSVELINAAWDHFQGEEPIHDGGQSSAQARLARAQTQLGVKESPAHSNECKYTDWYGMVGPWCAMFASWCDVTGAQPSGRFQAGTYYAYVPYIVDDARFGRRGLSIVSQPKLGDLVCYDWSRDGEYDHVGIIESPPNAAGAFTAIEGNTSPTSSGSQSNGGEVCRRTRDVDGQATVFVRVAEP